MFLTSMRAPKRHQKSNLEGSQHKNMSIVDFDAIYCSLAISKSRNNRGVCLCFETRFALLFFGGEGDGGTVSRPLIHQYWTFWAPL